jgi:hypothetical protein
MIVIEKNSPFPHFFWYMDREFSDELFLKKVLKEARQ